MMSLAVTEVKCGRKSSCKEGIADLGWSGECLSWRAAKVVSSGGANVSTELAILTAPLISPSSSLAETRTAIDLMGSLNEFRPLFGLGLVVTSGKSASASICLLTSEAKDPP